MNFRENREKKVGGITCVLTYTFTLSHTKGKGNLRENNFYVPIVPVFPFSR